jgi:hypothetical protein
MISSNYDPVQGLVDYVLDVKPYHTKIAEVIVEYVYNDLLNVSFKEDFHLWIHQDQPHSYFRAKVKGVGIPASATSYAFIGKTTKAFFVSGNFSDPDDSRALRPGFVINVSAQGYLTQQYTVSNVQYDVIQQYTIVSVREKITFGSETGNITVNGNAFIVTKAVFDTLQTAQWKNNANVDYRLVDCKDCSPCYNTLTQDVRNDAIVYQQYSQAGLPCYLAMKPKKKKGARTTKSKFVEYYGGNYTRTFAPGRKFRVKQSHQGTNDGVYTTKSSFYDVNTFETYVYVEEAIQSNVAPFGEVDVFMFDRYIKPTIFKTGYGNNFDGPHPDTNVYTIIAVDGRTNTITLNGDHREDFFTGELIVARHSVVNGTHTVLNTVLDADGDTVVYLYNNINGVPSGPALPTTGYEGQIFLLTEDVDPLLKGFYRYNGLLSAWQTYHGGEIVHRKYAGYDGTSIGHFESMQDLWLQVYFTEQLDITTTGVDFHDIVHIADMENPYRGLKQGYDVDPFGSYQADKITTIYIGIVGSDTATNAYILQGKRDTLFTKSTTFTVVDSDRTTVLHSTTVKGSLYDKSANTTHVFVNAAPLSGDLTSYVVPYTYKSVIAFPQHVGYSSFGEDMYHLSDMLEIDSAHNAIKVKGGNFLRRFVPTVGITAVNDTGTVFTTGHHTSWLPFANKTPSSFTVVGDYSWLYKQNDYVYLDYYPAPVRNDVIVRSVVYDNSNNTTELVVDGDRTVDLFRAAGRMIFSWTTMWITTTSAGIYNSSTDKTTVILQGNHVALLSPFIDHTLTVDFLTFPETTDGTVRVAADSVYNATTGTTLITTIETLSALDGYVLSAVYRHGTPDLYTYLALSGTIDSSVKAIYYKIPPSLRIDTEVELLDQASTSLFTNLYDQHATIYRRIDTPGGTLIPPPSSGIDKLFIFQQGNILQRFMPGYPFYGKNASEQITGPYRTAMFPVVSVDDYSLTFIAPADLTPIFTPGAQIYADYTGAIENDYLWLTISAVSAVPVADVWHITVDVNEFVPHPPEEIPISILSGVQVIEGNVMTTKVWVKNTTVAQDIVQVYHENWTSKNVENLVFEEELARPGGNNGLTRTNMNTSFQETVAFKYIVNSWFQYVLLEANHTNNTFVVNGNATTNLLAGSNFEVVGTNVVDGRYVAASVVYSPLTMKTTITTTTMIPPGWVGPAFKKGWVEPADTRFKWNVVASNTGSADLVVEGDATQDLWTGREFMLVLPNGNQFDNIRVQLTPVYDGGTHTTSLSTFPHIVIDASGGYVRHTAAEDGMYESFDLAFRDAIRVGFTEETIADSIGYSGYPSFNIPGGFASGFVDITPFDQNTLNSLHLYNSSYRF